jgi:hypothetical protein
MHRREQITVRLSDEQWGCLVNFIKPTGAGMTDALKSEMNKSISDYLTRHISVFSMNPSDFTKIFKKIEKLSGELLSIIENNFFPSDPENRDFAYNEIIRHRIRHLPPEGEKRLIKEKKIGKHNHRKNQILDENEMIRWRLVNWVNKVSINYFSTDVYFEPIRGCLYDLQALFGKILETMHSSRGKHGDSYLHELIALALSIYNSAGGKGITTKDAALPFMELLMEYVTEFARVNIGDDHARGLMHKTKGDQLKELIKATRRKKSLSE